MKHSVPAQTENDLIDFYRNAIRTRSYSNQEGDIAVLIRTCLIDFFPK